MNLVSAGPVETPAAQGIPGFEALAGLWGAQAPLGWDYGRRTKHGRRTKDEGRTKNYAQRTRDEQYSKTN